MKPYRPALVLSLAAFVTVPALETPVDPWGMDAAPVPTQSAGAAASSAGDDGDKPEPLAKQLAQQEYRRHPVGALRALATTALGSASRPSDAERFTDAVSAGDWRVVAATLATMAGEAGAVYDRLLEQLVKNDAILLPSEVVELAEIAPGDLDGERLRQLGGLLKDSLRQVAATGSLIARLETGGGRLGGATPAGRGLAAALMLAAGRVVEAGSFLPPLETALATGDEDAVDLHARYLFTVGRAEGDPGRLRRAWDLTQGVLRRAQGPQRRELIERALERALELLRDLPPDVGDAWLADTFRARPAQGHGLLAQVAAQMAQARNGKTVEARAAVLATQRRLVDALLAGTPGADWDRSLDLLALAWVEEAQHALGADIAEEGGHGDPAMDAYVAQQLRQHAHSLRRHPARRQQYIRYLRNQYTQQSHGDDDGMPQLPVAALLAGAPGDGWLERLDASLAQRLRSLIGECICLGGDRERALALIGDLAADEPQRGARLAAAVLRAWIRDRNGGDGSQDGGGSHGSSGIPLTRVRQVRDLDALAKLLRRLDALPVTPVPAALRVQAFVACHSQAEVFRADDIAAVLGDPDRLHAGALVQLIQAMRERLAGQWRKPAVQRQSGTNRTDAETAEEVERGYALVARLCASAEQRHPGAWQLVTFAAAAAFDHAEFAYGRQAPLERYAALRDGAFAGYARAAGAYAEALTADDERVVEPYLQWFNAALGASDLAYLTRQQEPDADQVARIRAALLALPGAESRRHLARFAEAVEEALGEVTGELKPRYVRHALRLIGDGAEGRALRDLEAGWNDLLAEVALDLRLDGETRVGSGTPFGAVLALRHTTALGREAGGFSKYLSNQVHSNGSQVDYRNDLEKHLREVLGERFAIASIAFAAPETTSRGFGREGWRELPLAYLVLSAKDAAVDRLPALRLDLDFSDRSGPVILPVASPETLIDARGPSAPTTTVPTALELTLDARDLDEGRLALGVRATGKGLLGDLTGFLTPAVPGFTVAAIEDPGVAVNGLEDDGTRLLPLCDRSWTVRYVPAQAQVPARFLFPKTLPAGLPVAYRRYDDADVVDAGAEVALSPRQPWAIRLRPWLIALAGAGTTALVILLARHRRRSGPARPAHRLPAELTPFTVLGALAALRDDPSAGLADERRAALARDIADLERRLFGRDAEGGGEAVERIARAWLATG